MARIKIEDLPVLEDLSAREKKGIFGGYLSYSLSDTTTFSTSTSLYDEISPTYETVEDASYSLESAITVLDGGEEPAPDGEVDGTTKEI